MLSRSDPLRLPQAMAPQAPEEGIGLKSESIYFKKVFSKSLDKERHIYYIYIGL